MKKIITEVYFKPIPCLYLLPSETHKEIIPYNLARRLCTIITDKNLLKFRLSELRYLLQQWGDPKSLAEHEINKANCRDRNELLQIKDKAKNVLFHTYQHTTRKIKGYSKLLKATFHF